MKFLYDALGGSRHGTDVAPAQAGTIVRNDAVGFSKFASDVGPAEVCGHQARLRELLLGFPGLPPTSAGDEFLN